MSMAATTARWLAFVQGGYFLITGVWPLIAMPSFEAVTGPKTDDWLVKTVGGLIAAIAAVLLWAAFRRAISLEIAPL